MERPSIIYLPSTFKDYLLLPRRAKYPSTAELTIYCRNQNRLHAIYYIESFKDKFIRSRIYTEEESLIIGTILSVGYGRKKKKVK